MPPLPRLIGMVHLGPLPGAPRFDGDFDTVVARAVSDAEVLAASGFEGIGVENFGDAPFFRDDVPKVTIAAMTRAIAEVAKAVRLPVGVNVLRNDACGALAIAAATSAAFIRVNVLSGSMWTDQGLIIGKAADVLRLRKTIAPDTKILADVFVKHATPPPGATLEQAAEELAGRGLADALIVSGTATGRPPTITTLRDARNAVPDVPLYVGSGASAGNVAQFLAVADGVIVGTTLKLGSHTTNPVDPERARAFADAGRRALAS
ncbi:MAG TPA: BtpA/SgcQ family protein [Acidimicrobiia bacterium]|nr:BtpA/SgcQ family protein [Acidimicrobiia bacterium]